MRLSRYSEYAIRLIFYLLDRQPLDTFIRIKDVAKELEVSYYQLAKVAAALISAGVLRSNTGPNGGIDLSEDLSKVTLIKVLGLFGDGDVFDRCVLGLEECSVEAQCPVHSVWDVSKRGLKAAFFNKPLDVVLKEYPAGLIPDAQHGDE
jgi:Rrf2 family protein